MLKGLELKEGMFLQITGMEIKNRNDIFIIDCDYNKEEYAPCCNNEYCLNKVKINGELKTAGYDIIFLSEYEIKKNPNMVIKIVTNLKEAKKEVNAYLKGNIIIEDVKEEILQVAPIEVAVTKVEIITENNEIVEATKTNNNIKISTVLKSDVREMVVIKENNNKSMYGWIEGKILTVVDLAEQRQDEKLFLTKEKLVELFPLLTLEKHVRMEWNDSAMTVSVIPVHGSIYL